MLTDIEIAHNTKLKRIDEVAQQLGIDPEAIEHYGKHIAKLPLSLIDEKKKGKLILVTAITATKAGIGKTTVSIGLALGLNAIGKKAMPRYCQWNVLTYTSRAISMQLLRLII